jgi:hypothetical protein
MTQIWIAAIDHKHGTNLYASETEAGLYQQLAEYCRDYWDQDGPNEPIPSDDREIIKTYFDHQAEHGSEWHIVEKVELGN